MLKNNTQKNDIDNLTCSKFIESFVDENETPVSINFMNTHEFNFAFDIVDILGEKYPDKLAMLHISNRLEERRFTFADISKESSRTANYFISLGIKKGDKVMLVLKKHYQFWFSILALHKIGAIAIPATSQLQKYDFKYRFESADVSAIVCTSGGDTANQAQQAAEELGCNIKKIIVGESRDGWHNFDDEFQKFDTEYKRTSQSPCGDDPLIMFFTSGTTGYPKIVTHTHTYPLGHFITARYWHDIKPDGLHLTVSDTGWGKALWGKLYGQWLCEAAVFVYDSDRFNALKLLTMFKKYNIKTFCAPPTIYRMFIKEDLSKYDLSSIQHATTAGEALNPEVLRKIKEMTGLTVMEGFGQTETTLTVANLVGMTPKFGSMGKPVPTYHIHLLKENGEECKVGETGEISIDTRNSVPCGLFSGYYNDDKATKGAWYDGMYHTGDIAKIDEDGFLWFIGRHDDLIKSSGYRISPLEVENVIMELPYVLECGVSSEPDKIRGCVVKASIVLIKGQEGTDELKKEIQKYVKSKTAPYKYPRIIEFKHDLPKTISGKIMHNKL